MASGISHLHTYFLFPFSVDKQALLEDHRGLWAKHQHWIDGLDGWLAAHRGPSPVVEKIGPWRRAAYTRFELDSRAYQDMIFFHPIVRRVFFDTAGESDEDSQTLLRCYSIPLEGRPKVRLSAEDRKGRNASVDVTDLRLFLFANGIGILSIGVEAEGISAAEALWINEALRKVCPSSGRQMREGRAPSRISLLAGDETVAEERFENVAMHRLQPPLSKTITSLLYFADYERQEYEAVLDERMIVYTYAAIDPDTIGEDYIHSDEYQVLLSRFLYVDRAADVYRYDPAFIRREMSRQLYRRWAHEGTWYGFTSFSNISVTIGSRDCDEHQLEEGFLIQRMFNTRYYLMAIVALFYRATLLEFAVRSALVSRRLFLDWEDGRFAKENIRLAGDLRAEYLHFANYWYFSELANKDEEVEHFALQCREYRIDTMRTEIEEEIDKLNRSLDSEYQFRATDAVNRLAILSLIFGAGAVLTGFFGMNFGRGFASVFFEPAGQNTWVHYAAIAAVALLSFGALAFGLSVVIANWADYRHILLPTRKMPQSSLKR